MTEKEQLAADLAEYRRIMALLSDESREAVTSYIREVNKE